VSDFLYYVVIIIIMGLSFVFLKRRHRVAAAELTPAKSADAARVGWQFETDQSALFEIFRWRGTTDGVSWVAEAVRSGRSRSRLQGSTARIVRWYTIRPFPVPGAIATLHTNDGDEAPPQLPSDKDGGAVAQFGTRMIAAALDKGFDIRFGDEIGRQIDIGKMTQLSAAESPGRMVFVDEGSRGSALLTLQKADAAVKASGDSLAPASYVIAPGGVAVSVQAWAGTVDELMPIVQAGVALARSQSM
jgi:hypothetical protein